MTRTHQLLLWLRFSAKCKRVCVWEVYPSRTSRTISRFEVLLKESRTDSYSAVNPAALSRLVSAPRQPSPRTKNSPYCMEPQFHSPSYRLHLPKLLSHNRLPPERATVYDKEVPVSWHQPQRREQRQSCMIYNILYCRHAFSPWRPICYFTLSSGA